MVSEDRLRLDVLSRLEKVERVKTILMCHATGQAADGNEYTLLRRSLIADPVVKDRLPPFVRRYRTLDEFWGYIKQRHSTYAERRTHLAHEFDGLISALEDAHAANLTQHTERLLTVDSVHVQAAWTGAIERRHADPQGAITAARTVLESVCKFILDQSKTPYKENADLPDLYKAVAGLLQLSPQGYAESVFKQILGGCFSVIEGLGALRNRLGDAHGKGAAIPRPQPRHAQLAVNLAGAAAVFLIETWEARQVKACAVLPLNLN
ncbi:MAG TPA: abortive infection family protein [Phycisphaerales bacterium]|nr:abortive infection family protein [Phycisphaerales bacterium]